MLNLGYSSDLGVLVLRTRIHDEEGFRELTYIPHNNQLLPRILTNMHKRHHHWPLPTLIALFQQEFITQKLQLTSKSIFRNCFVCRRDCGRLPVAPTLPPLPRARTELTRPFNCVGLVYIGAFLVYQGCRALKACVAVATCLSTRGVFLDHVHSLNTNSETYTEEIDGIGRDATDNFL